MDIAWKILNLSLTGTIIGGLVTFLVVRWYYIRAARDLELETQKARNLLRIALQAMEQAGMVQLTRDESGQIMGMIHRGEAHLTTSTQLKAEGSSLNKIHEE